MSSPHVLRLTPHFYWPQLASAGWPVKFDAIGGMQTQIYRQTLALSKLGIRQTVLTLRIPGAPRIWKVDERTKVIGVRVPIFPVRSRLRGMMDLNISWAVGVLSQLSRLQEAPDLVHSHWSGVAVPPWLGERVRRRLSQPAVATVHCSSLSTYHAMSPLDRLQHRLARGIESRALSRLNAVIALTPRAASNLTNAVASVGERIHVIPDCIDSQEFARWATPDKVAAFRRSNAIPTGRPVVGFVGRIAREKGWRGLLDIADSPEMRDAFFLVCGDGNERDLLEVEIARRGLASRFAITGYVPNETVAIALKACDAIVLPSCHEEFGSVLLEAMSVGVPCVAFKIGGVPHVLADGEAGRLVAAGDYREMAHAVAQLLERPQETARMVAAAASHVDRLFDCAATVGAMAELYRSLLGSR